MVNKFFDRQQNFAQFVAWGYLPREASLLVSFIGDSRFSKEDTITMITEIQTVSSEKGLPVEDLINCFRSSYFPQSDDLE